MSKDKDKKYGMVPIPVFKARKARAITANDIVIYAAIASFASKETGVAYPNQKRISELTGTTQACISRSISRLIEAGLLETKAERHVGRKLYYILSKHPIGKPGTGVQSSAVEDEVYHYKEAEDKHDEFARDSLAEMLSFDAF